MSMPKRDEVRCRACGQPVPVTIFQSINTDYAENVPDLIRSKELFQVKCPKCGTTGYLEYDMLYNDLKHNTMIWMIHPGSEDYKQRVDSARDEKGLFFGTDDLLYKRSRLVSSMDELREKVTCLELGRDDRLIELCKFMMVVNAPEKIAEKNLQKGFYYRGSDGKEYISLIGRDKKEAGRCVLTEQMYESVKRAFAERLPDRFRIPFPIVDIFWASDFFHDCANNPEA